MRIREQSKLATSKMQSRGQRIHVQSHPLANVRNRQLIKMRSTRPPISINKFLPCRFVFRPVSPLFFSHYFLFFFLFSFFLSFCFFVSLVPVSSLFARLALFAISTRCNRRRGVFAREKQPATITRPMKLIY